MELNSELANDVFLTAAMFYAMEHCLKLLDLFIEICIKRIKNRHSPSDPTDEE